MGKSQEQKILQYLIKHGSITQKEAVDHFDCYRLSARIAELRRTYKIITKFEPNKGHGTHARYFLIEEGEDDV